VNTGLFQFVSPIMKSAHFLRIALLLVAMVFSVAAVRAEDLGAVKARMEQRIAPLNAMKDRGAAGENNQGFLEARAGATSDDQRVIGEENADRRTVYAAIAAQTGATPDAVGRHRAQQIASIARPGHWIQDPSGIWRQK
jgi:uncharacterized protein YdbL (DUF1318 family)